MGIAKHEVLRYVHSMTISSPGHRDKDDIRGC